MHGFLLQLCDSALDLWTKIWFSCKFLGLFTDGWPHAVGKRTPRVPVIHNKGDGDNSVSNNKNVIKPAPDEDTYTATLTLIEASQGGGSLLVSLSPRRRELSRSPNEKVLAYAFHYLHTLEKFILHIIPSIMIKKINSMLLILLFC